MEQLHNDDIALYLQGFAPLIQLWAGICLLFFYETLLEKSPFGTLCKEIHQLYENFRYQYNGLIPEKAITADEYVKDHWSNNYVPTIKCIASMCFFYSTFILAYIGIEGNEIYDGEYYCALQVTNTILWLYLVGAIIFYKSRIFHGYWSSVILTILLLIYFHLHFPINNFFLSYLSLGKGWDRNSITIYTVFSCIGGILLICLRIFISLIILQCQKWSVRNMNKEFRFFADYNLGKIKRDELPKKNLNRILKRCTEKFSKGELKVIDTNAFLEEMKKEVVKEYNDFTNKWWIKLY